MAGESGQALLVGRLHPDWEVARHAAFALLVLVYLEQAGLIARGPVAGDPAPEALPAMVAAIQRQNPHLLRWLDSPERQRALAGLDRAAMRELRGWLAAQHLDREEPAIAYELAILALGIELPPILVSALREVKLEPESRVAELPDGAGYATIFLATLHTQWRASEGARLFVEGADAEQLAGWAMVLLSRRLAARPGSITRVAAGDCAALRSERFDLAVVYNPVPWLAAPEAVLDCIDAAQVVLV